MRWADVDLRATDSSGTEVGEIRLSGAMTKTGRGRRLHLEVSPMLRRLLAAMKLASDATGCVLEGYTVDSLKSARARLLGVYGAPSFDWQMLRSTCGTYLTNSQGIYGAATVFLAARQLGHSVAIAEKHYLGVERSIPADARTLEAAMRIEKHVCDASRRRLVPDMRQRPGTQRNGRVTVVGAREPNRTPR